MVNFNKFFLEALGERDKLKFFVENNIHLVNQISEKNPLLLSSIRFIVNLCGREKLLKDFDYQGLMFLFRDERPDLFNEINNSEKARLWLYNQIENFKNYF